MIVLIFADIAGCPPGCSVDREAIRKDDGLCGFEAVLPRSCSPAGSLPARHESAGEVCGRKVRS